LSSSEELLEEEELELSYFAAAAPLAGAAGAPWARAFLAAGLAGAFLSSSDELLEEEELELSYLAAAAPLAGAAGAPLP